VVGQALLQEQAFPGLTYFDYQFIGNHPLLRDAVMPCRVQQRSAEGPEISSRVALLDAFEADVLADWRFDLDIRQARV
jgi:hypothetical protein